MADALVSEASAARCEGSTPSLRTNKKGVRTVFLPENSVLAHFYERIGLDFGSLCVYYSRGRKD